MSEYVISVDLAMGQLKYTAQGVVQLQAPIVQGCDESPSLSGEYQAGKWVRDKTNPTYGKTPWSQANWQNPYGPYFLEILNANGHYTSYGIHGTRGPGWSPAAKPPLPERLLKWVLDEERAKYLYCSHGCIRISNVDIQQLHKLTAPIMVHPGVLKINITK